MAKHYQPRKSFLSLLILTGLLATGVAVGASTSPKLAIDLRGGTEVILAPIAPGGKAVSKDQLDQTVRIIRQRVDGFGVAESEVTTQGSGASAKIVVRIPGTTSGEVVNDLKNTAKLNFRQVLDLGPGVYAPPPTSTPQASIVPGQGSASTQPSTSAKPSVTATPKATKTTKASPRPTVPASWLVPPIQFTNPNDIRAKKTFEALDCSKFKSSENGSTDDEKKYLITCDKTKQVKYVLAPAELSGQDIKDAQAGVPEQGAGGYQVQLTLTTKGAVKFAKVTQQLAKESEPKNQFGIVLDGIVMSAPRVNEAILGGSAVITGDFTADTAKILAQELKFGALPITLKVDENTQISPTLGNDQLRAGILAGAFGLLIVILYLFLYYRVLGLVAVVSLLVATLLTYLSFVLLGNQIGFTLSLPGVAGAIVAIGITADSFVVYFERIRDELREGKRLRTAVDQGWSRARRTILAADFVSLLAAFILYFLSIGSVRGFAFTLGLTTIIDIVVAFWFTRPLVYKLAETKFMNSGTAMTGVSPERLGAPVRVESSEDVEVNA